MKPEDLVLLDPFDPGETMALVRAIAAELDPTEPVRFHGQRRGLREPPHHQPSSRA